MMTRPENTSAQRKGWPDLLLVAIIFALCSWGGYTYLASHESGQTWVSLETYIYGPALMLATGHGFYEPDRNAVPEAYAFLEGDVASPDPALWPETIAPDSAPYTHASEYHRYLNYTVALLWRVFGISRESLAPFAALLMGWAAVAVYGLMRLGMGRVLAFLLALTVAFSPPMLLMLPHLRDFSKAPFLLTLIYLLAYLMRYCRNNKQLVIWGAVLGGLHGVAMGFRQDAIIFVPLAFIVLTGVGVLNQRKRPRENASGEKRGWIRCFSALFVYAFVFLIVAWPMLSRMEGGADPYWPIVQGFSNRHTQNMGITFAQYMPHASAHDNYTSNTLCHYYRRAHHKPNAYFADHSDIARMAGRQWLLAMGTNFPADVLTRAYGSVLRILRYADIYSPERLNSRLALYHVLAEYHQAFGAHIHRFGIFYAALALLLMSGYRYFVALGVFLLGMYLCAYVSLQSEPRHTFYLAFVPFWIVGFLSACAGHGLQSLGTRIRNCVFPGQGMPPDRKSLRPVLIPGRMVLFAVCILLLTVTPLQLLRLYQRHAAQDILAPYVQAERVAGNYSTHTAYGWTVFDLEPLEDTHPGAGLDSRALPDPQRDIEALYQCIALAFSRIPGPAPRRSRYVIAEFDGNNPPDMVLIRYDPTHSFNHFSQLIPLPSLGNPAEPVYHGIPIYETLEDPRSISFGYFEGIAVPEAHAAGFKGFYEVLNVSAFPFLMHLTWAKGDDFTRPLFHKVPARPPLHHRLNFFPDPLYYEVAPHFLDSFAMLAARAQLSNRQELAQLFYGLRLLFPLDLHGRLTVGRKLLELGAVDRALEVAGKIVEHDTETQELRALFLFDIFSTCIEDGAMEGRAPNFTAAWAALELLIASEAPNASRLALQAGDLFIAHGFVEQGHDCFLTIMIAFPDYEAGVLHISTHFGDMGTGALSDFWGKVVQSRPDTALPWLQLVSLREEEMRRDDAPTSHDVPPESIAEQPAEAILYLTQMGSSLEVDRVLELASRIVATYPRSAEAVARITSSLARSYYHREAYGCAVRLLENALVHAPDNLDCQLLAAQALAGAGSLEKARALFEVLLDTSVGSVAASLLEELYAAQYTPEQQVILWRTLWDRQPEQTGLQWHYARALWAAGSYEQAAAHLTVLVEANVPIPHLPLWRHVSALAAGIESREESPLLSYNSEQASHAVELLLGAADTLAASNNADRAENLIRLATTIAPESSESWYALGSLLESHGAIDEALRIYIEARAYAADKRPFTMRIQALCDMVASSAVCLDIWRELASADSNDLIALQHLGMALEKQARWEQASTAYRSALALDPADPDITLNLARVLMVAGHVTEGARILSELARDHESMKPEVADILVNAVAGLIEAGEADQAETVSRLATACAPGNPFGWLWLGDALIRGEDREGALGAWREVVCLMPEGPMVAEVLRRLDNTAGDEERLLFWREAVTRTGDALMPRMYYARSLAWTGHQADALNRIVALSHDYPGHAHVDLSHGVILCHGGDMDAGLTRIQDALAASPELTEEALNEVNALARRLADDDLHLDTAERLIRAARLLAADDPRHDALLGRVLLSQGRIEEAIASFMLVLLVAPESPHTAALLDEAYLQLDAPEARRNAWKRIVEMHPEAEVPRRHLGRDE